MLKTYHQYGKKFYFYYDTEKQTIARFPTKSNLLLNGSDNSLFFGLTSDATLCKLMCEFFGVSRIKEISGLSYEMSCGGEMVDVVVNVNAEGQIQIKLCKNGTMGRLSSNYAFEEMREIDFTQWLIVIDFKHKEIRFKDPQELKL